MSDVIKAAQQVSFHPATERLPTAFDYPVGGILARTAVGLALLVIGVAMLLQAGTLWIVGGALLILLGGLAAVSNIVALLDPERRKIVLDRDGIEIRYGISRRHYRFLDYSDYRIARLGLRRFLTALPVDVERSLGKPVERVRVTIYDRPAFLTPMPMLGNGAPATLLEWQVTLNELRRAAIAAAGPTAAFEAREETAEDSRRAAAWRAREAAGAMPSRLSRRAYARGRFVLTLAFVVLLLAPIGFAAAVRQGIVPACGAGGGSGCLGIEALLQLVMIGGPLLAVLVFVVGHAYLTVRRAHDLDVDLSFWQALVAPLGRYGPLQRRLAREEGTGGANRFGPVPPA